MRRGNSIFKDNVFEYFFVYGVTCISTASDQQPSSIGHYMLPRNRPGQTGTLSRRMIFLKW